MSRGSCTYVRAGGKPGISFFSLDAGNPLAVMVAMADASGIRLPSMAPVLHFARRQDIVAFPLARVA